jgi:enoyl-CoA hydratase/carnithine racemase
MASTAERFEVYADRYEHIRMSRHDGVLEMELHTSGGPLIWSASAHAELPRAFADIAGDRENRVVLLTGTGDSFCAKGDLTFLRYLDSAAAWDEVYWEGKQLLENLLRIEVPVVAAVNGPARYHAELAVLSDIVLASETACFQDRAHMAIGGVPGDGVQVVWPLVLGLNRGRYFLLTGQSLSAREALELGVVSEVLPPADLLPRARAVAAELAAKPLLALRYSRVVLTQFLRRQMADQLGPGLGLEGLAFLGARFDQSTNSFRSADG